MANLFSFLVAFFCDNIKVVIPKGLLRGRFLFWGFQTEDKAGNEDVPW